MPVPDFRIKTLLAYSATPATPATPDSGVLIPDFFCETWRWPPSESFFSSQRLRRDRVPFSAKKVNLVRGQVECNSFSALRTVRAVHLDHDQWCSLRDFDMQVSLAAKILHNVHDSLDRSGRSSVFQFDMLGSNAERDRFVRFPTIRPQRQCKRTDPVDRA